MLSALALSPAAVDVASALDVVVVTTTITDDLSGVAASTLCGWAYRAVPARFASNHPRGAALGLGSPNGWAGITSTPSE